MRIAICEDQENELIRIHDFLQDYFYKNDYAVDIDTFSSGEDLLENFTSAKFEVVFLDIYMKEMNGIETARALRKIDSEFTLVYITSSLNHGLDAFSQRASAYVTKPVNSESMALALKQCEPIFSKSARTIEVMSNRSPLKLPHTKILYVEIYHKDALFHMTSGIIRTQMALSDIEKQLGSNFLRCHRSYLVNMNAIDSIREQDILLVNGEAIPIRIKGKTKIRKEYGDFASNNLFKR